MSLSFAQLAARAAAAKTSEETIVIDVGELLSITDYFVVTAGRNDRQVRAIVDSVTETLRDGGAGSPHRSEGLGEANWVLLDYGEFVVHVFQAETRSYYDLERLWADAPRVELEDLDDERFVDALVETTSTQLI